ncbi:MAG: glutaredoxin family protein [Deltaproteobacteria bacterium]|nr:glutaredoxin family protein [Deltaproteobacteria bacterium]
MAQTKQILIYGLSTCPYCRRAKEFMNNNNISYTMVEVDLLVGADKDAAVKKVAELNPRLSFPTIKIYDDHSSEVYVGMDDVAQQAMLAVLK